MGAQYNQCQIEYMLANGATSTEKGLCTREFLLSKGVVDAALGDMWYEYLSAAYPAGYSRTAMESQFWFDVGCRAYDAGLPAGSFGLSIIGAWTGFRNCAPLTSVVTHLGIDVTHRGVLVTHNP